MDSRVFWPINIVDAKEKIMAREKAAITKGARDTAEEYVVYHRHGGGREGRAEIVLTSESLRFSTRNAVIARLAISLG